ncbi:aldo/keto reductase [Cohnella terricola]|uniref:Aldo/keto reductase n=2 Tax=Cohnella terricola TaxID=1289167 RepID=A0A559JBB7_9BACL|nr:aldo/keto reductase [Cohnella terricola]
MVIYKKNVGGLVKEDKRLKLRLDSTAELLNGVEMPRLGLGVWNAKEGPETENAVLTALKAGYRSIDTASMYGNEAAVGRAVRASGIPREQIFVTTKVWNNDQGYDSTIKACRASLDRLGLDYVDLYLIHWPVEGKSKETYKALEDLYAQGLAKAIGVSNFDIAQLDELMGSCRIKPMVNQVEINPLHTQKKLFSFCRTMGIQLEAWRPLMYGKLDLPLLEELAVKYGKSPAQIVIRWHLQLGIVAIPKSVNEERIRENANVFDFELEPEDMLRIDALNKNYSTG